MISLRNTAALIHHFGAFDASMVLWLDRIPVVLAAAAVMVATNPALAQSTCNISSGASQALGANSFACGPNAIVIGANSNPANPVRGTALGDAAQAVGNDATAVGQFAYADTSSTSLGSGSEALDQHLWRPWQQHHGRGLCSDSNLERDSNRSWRPGNRILVRRPRYGCNSGKFKFRGDR